MHDTNEAIAALGNEPPLIADGRSGPPDRREVSARWLSGTFLTGLTSSVLMGVALFAALDGREQLATPPEIASPTDMNKDGVAGRASENRATGPCPPGRPRQGPPPDGSVHGEQGRRPRRDPHRSLRADQDGARGRISRPPAAIRRSIRFPFLPRTASTSRRRPDLSMAPRSRAK